MTADTLRRAAAQIRNDHGGVISRHTEDGRRWLPVADLLEAVTCACMPCSSYAWATCDGCEPIEAALAVARAYLGEPS